MAKRTYWVPSKGTNVPVVKGVSFEAAVQAAKIEAKETGRAQSIFTTTSTPVSPWGTHTHFILPCGRKLRLGRA